MAAQRPGLQGHPCRWRWLKRKQGQILLHQRRGATSGALATAMLGAAVICAGLLRRCRISERFGVVICVPMPRARKVFCWRADGRSRRVH
jgi:hypothetical protein